jgi:hypothetical protein
MEGKRRVTEDGRKCASSFIVDGVMHKDCTRVHTPDGKNEEKEWCYVDPLEGGSPNWGLCIPNLDFDRMRRYSRDLLNSYIPEIRRIRDIIVG